MYLFDLHCDTLSRCIKKSEPIAFADGHISLERGSRFERWGQVFAVFVPDNLRGEAAADHADGAMEFYRCQKRLIKQVCRPVLAVENGNSLAGDLRRLDLFAERGVRLFALTWNGANELGHGAYCDPALGLTDFGKAAVKRMFKLGMIPDVSHLNEAGFRDVAELAEAHKKPFWATHSNCAAVRPHPRNLEDDQLKAIFESGGLVGVNLFIDFLGGSGTAYDVGLHLEHMIALGGEDHVALGSDFDGCDIHPSLAGVEKLENLDSDLERFGFSDAQRKKFFWTNASKALANPPRI